MRAIVDCRHYIAICYNRLPWFTAQMEGIYTTSVGADTLDESPMAYKSLEDIVGNIAPTAEIKRRILPVYNFKAGGEPRPWQKRKK